MPCPMLGLDITWRKDIRFTMTSKPQLVSDNSNPADRSQTNKPKGGPAYRIRSVRGYRRMLDWATRRMLQGHLSKEDLLAITSAAKAGAELMMAENILSQVGEDRELEHTLGDDGGFKRPRKPRGFVKRKVVVKSGIGKDGKNVDETAITREGDIRDGDDDTIPL